MRFYFGKVERRPSGGLQFTNPQYEIVDDESTSGVEKSVELIHTGRDRTDLRTRRACDPEMFRRIVHTGLARLPDAIDDPLPEPLRRELGLPERREALIDAHFPSSRETLDQLNQFRSPAQRRLIFEEFFAFQVGLAVKRKENDTRRKPLTIRVDDRIRRAALDVLPFPTHRRAASGTEGDRRRPPAAAAHESTSAGRRRLGKDDRRTSGGTGDDGERFQVAVMSPTELLAEQHFLTLSRLLADTRFTVVRLTGRWV